MIFKHADDHKREPKRVIWADSYPRDAFLKNWGCSQRFCAAGDIVWINGLYRARAVLVTGYKENARANRGLREDNQNGTVLLVETSISPVGASLSATIAKCCGIRICLYYSWKKNQRAITEKSNSPCGRYAYL